jgi:hypothetical protein
MQNQKAELKFDEVMGAIYRAFRPELDNWHGCKS